MLHMKLPGTALEERALLATAWSTHFMYNNNNLLLVSTVGGGVLASTQTEIVQ